METEQETQEDVPQEETYEENLQPEQEIEQEEHTAAEESTKPIIIKEEERPKNLRLNSQWEDRSPFIHGLAVGLGIGCIATFVIVWITVFFTPKMPSAVTYENLLSIFIYPLIYLLAVGLIALTAGIVREYYAMKNRF